MRVLPPPEFVKIDAVAIEADLVARYEQRSGKILYPAQIERLFIDQIAYARTLSLMAIQHAGEQLLVRYSDDPILDYLGELVGTLRLLAKPARCPLQFKVPASALVPRLIPAGTRVASQDGRIIFSTDLDVVLPAGRTIVSATATCETLGEVGNGWAIGQISTVLDEPIDGLTASNEQTTSDGFDEETHDRYRERIILAPEAFTNAGSRGAYRFHALSVHQSIIDVAVHGPDEGQQDGHVALFPLTESGSPSQSLLQDVLAYVSGEKVRPLCDTVHVLLPIEISFTIAARLTLYSTVDRASTMAIAQSSIEAYAAHLRAGLGRDIVPEQIIAALQVSGVYQAIVELPAGLQKVQSNEWANCISIQLVDVGVSDG